MRKLEKIIIGLVLGFIMPVFFMLAGWWGSLSFVPESMIKYYALGGFILGLVINLFMLRKWIGKVYEFNLYALIAIYIFYAIGIFGFFMGVPLFNLLPGIIAGAYAGRRLYHHKADRQKAGKIIGDTALIAGASMLAVCIVSAVIALSDPYTPANLKGMLGLRTEVTPLMVRGIIIIGGAALILLQYWLARAAAFRAYKAIDK